MTDPSPMQPSVVARLVANERDARQIADALIESLDPDAVAVSAFETGATWTVEAIFRDDPDRSSIASLVAAAAGADAADRLTFNTLAPRDWVQASLSGLRPVRAARFFVHGAHDRARVPLNAIGIEIEAALAFGTGHHGTTYGCLMALDTFLKSRASSPGRKRRTLRILDVGTGTGILSIAAARALHAPVMANDIDGAAVRVARENARHNRAGPLVTVFRTGSLSLHALRQRAPYDLILANILARPLIGLARSAIALLRPGGCIILSGLMPEHANAVVSAYRARGLVLVSRSTRDNWVTLVMHKGMLPDRGAATRS